MGCPGLHCDGCGSGGPTAGAVIALIILGVLAAAHRTIEHAALDVLHFIEIAAIVVGGLGVTASVIAMTVLTVRIRQRRAPAAVAAPRTVQAIVVERGHAAIEGGRDTRFHGDVSATRAEAITASGED